ncbi:DNA ligase D [Ancylobacter sp. 6x-1]|uniref:DNA ligase (ATP) n=1 Tax=Ancylobacter crimeensis TaxID=2579147 RepID=A0ABT0DAZ9_9HYPH|nr:DNA ligase D [Ancylobacter crimeensis]MCK0197129.1 DNA ligase D [Ancylobacter crimeensis]
MALETYRRKRNFRITSEPSGMKSPGARPGTAPRDEAAGLGTGAYLIQKHDARRLHYDFRLELDGVLLSWAVTRGPSLVPGEKRLAVHVEDHPLDYGTFEGIIPKGQYGGGTVELWDRGSWRPIGDPHKALKKGHLEFELTGEKLHGRWHLVRMHGKPGESRENWLLIKGEDEWARTPDQPDILEEQPDSVKTGRSLAEIAAAPAAAWDSGKGGPTQPEPAPKPAKDTTRKPSRTRAAVAATVEVKRAATATGGTSKGAAADRAAKPVAPPKPGKGAKPGTSAEPLKGAKAAPLPDFVPPELATLVPKPPSGERWVHEIKFDGYRIEARIDHSRSGDAAVRLLTRTGLDWTHRFGEAIVAALAALPVEDALLDGEIVVETSGGASDFSALQADLSEGRSDRFVYYLFDCLHRDGRDLTGAALTARKEALRDLLPEGSVLRYSESFEEDGGQMLRHACRLSLEGVVSKLKDGPYRSGRGRGWVKSKCSARQEFVIGGFVPSTTSPHAIGSLVMGVNEEGGLRHVGRVGTGYSARMARDLHARLEPLEVAKSPFADRLDRAEAADVHFVKPELVAEVEFRAWTGSGHIRHAAFRGLREDKAAADVVAETATGGPAEGVGNAAPAKAAPSRAAARSSVVLTHPDRIYWPEDGITKEGLAAYYSEVWRSIAPYIVARPLALLRCPDGVAKQCFFQKHGWRGMNRKIRQVADPKDAGGEPILAIDDLDGLIALVQSGVLEIHPWGARLADLEHPDMLIFDLDPGEKVGWPAMIAGAREVKARLEAQGLAAFVKTSGGKGLHVVAPLKPKAGWDEAKAFAKALASDMAEDTPDSFVAVATKARRPGRIFVDYLRNGRGATAVAPYSTRARVGAAVSMPVAWGELTDALSPSFYTVGNAPARLANLAADPWADFRAAAVPLETGRARGRRKG